jgi:ABC-2 type transport system permease protein
VLEGMRAAVLDGASMGDVAEIFPPLLAIAAVVLPLGILVFRTAERYALRSGRLKRHG